MPTLESLDSPGELLQKWRTQRAYRVGKLISICASIAASFVVAADFYWHRVVLFDVILLAGCLTSCILTFTSRRAYFFWWPMYTVFWLSLLSGVSETRGLDSPFLGIYLGLLFVGGVIIQIRVSPLWIFSFVVLQVPLIHFLPVVWPFQYQEPTPGFIAFMHVIGLCMMGACIYALLRTEAELIRQFSERHSELINTRIELRREEASNMAKTTFLANVSHELRTPLAAIMGYSDLLSEAGELSHEQEGYLETVRRNGKQLSHLVDDLLDLSRIEAGTVEINRSRSQLTDMLTEILNLSRLAAVKKGLYVNVEYLNPIPRYVSFDSLRVRQIILNLIGNAIKFTEHGGITLAVKYLSSDKGAHLKFTITDTGRGISSEERSRLFKPFSQGDPSLARRYGGTGLGLSLSRRLADLMGGSLNLESSQPGVGSTFSLELPIGMLQEQEWLQRFEATVEETSSKKKMDKNRLRGVRVLYVDDTVDNQQLVRVYMTSVGAEIDMASNGYEGIEKAQKNDYDVVLMDIQMPLMDGYEAVTRLRSLGYSKPILALTAHAMSEDRQRCYEVGCNGHLTKPISNVDLIQAIEKVLLSKTG